LGTGRTIDYEMTRSLAIVLRPIFGGWVVCLTNGRELARFRGPWARIRALRYLRTELRLQTAY
jgi:hypothetical protein